MMSWLFSDPLPIGSPAPDFSLPDDTGCIVSISALRGKSVVLVFYPADDTPTCTRQLCEFRDNWSEAAARGVEIFGVNPRRPASHAKFRAKFRFPFPLLVDAGQKVARLYHADSPIVVRRTVYLIGPDGAIRFAQRGVPSPKEVLAAAPAAL